MKKLYTSALAALCVIGASAGINGVRDGFMGERNNAADAVKSNLKESAFVMKKVETKKLAAVTTAAENQSIDGEYTVYVGDYYFKSSVGPIEVPATIALNEGTITITSDWFPTEVTADFDEENGIISFDSKKLGKMTLGSGEEEAEYYVRFEPFAYEEGVTPGKYSAEYDAELGQITFPENHGFSWVAYSDSKYTFSEGYLDLFDVEGLELATNWAALGEGVFTDNSVSAGFGKAPAPYSVAVYQSTIDENVYKVINPLAGLFEELNFASVSPTWYLDATDVENVLLGFSSTRINGGQDGLYYVFNDGYYSYMTEEVPDAYTTLTTDESETTFTFEPGSLLLFASASNKVYALGEEASTIVIKNNTAGVAEIEVNDNNAPVEYFNLQGVRVDNPAAGQFLIKRQGSTVTKTIVR